MITWRSEHVRDGKSLSVRATEGARSWAMHINLEAPDASVYVAKLAFHMAVINQTGIPDEENRDRC